MVGQYIMRYRALSNTRVHAHFCAGSTLRAGEIARASVPLCFFMFYRGFAIFYTIWEHSTALLQLHCFVWSIVVFCSLLFEEAECDGMSHFTSRGLWLRHEP